MLQKLLFSNLIAVLIIKSLTFNWEKFWTSKEVVELCERLSGKTANISYIPTFGFSILRNLFRCFEFTWNIADYNFQNWRNG